MPIDNLPERLRPPARRLKKWLLTEGFLLVILGLGMLGKGVDYLRVPPRPTIHPVEAFTTPTVWAIVWIVGGILCFLCSLSPQNKIASFAVGFAVSIFAAWGVSFLLSGMGPWLYGVGAAVPYIIVAVMVPWSMWVRNRITIINMPPTIGEVEDAIRGHTK